MITDPNYEIALTLLPEKDKNIRCLVLAHLKMTRTRASKKSESGFELPKNLEKTNEQLRALKNIGEPADSWYSLLFFWITENMNNQSKKQ